MTDEEKDQRQKELLEGFEKYIIDNYSAGTNKEENTKKAYLSDVSLFLKYFRETFDEIVISFSRANIEEYKNYMREKANYKPATINRKLASVSVYENFLIEQGVKETKAVRKKDFFRIITPYISADMLPKKTMKKVKLAAGQENERDYLIVVLIDEAGLRVSELINMQLERDIDLEMRKITIWGKENTIREGIITNAMLDALEEYLPIREKKLAGRQNKYLIVSNKSVATGKKVDRTLINKILEKYCIEIKENKINPHIYRHGFATDKYEIGYTDMMLKKALGQTSNATNKYVHPGGEEKRLDKTKKD